MDKSHGSLLPYEQWKQEIERNPFLFHSRFGRLDLNPYEGLKAFLFLDGGLRNIPEHSIPETSGGSVPESSSPGSPAPETDEMESLADLVEAQESNSTTAMSKPELTTI